MRPVHVAELFAALLAVSGAFACNATQSTDATPRDVAAAPSSTDGLPSDPAASGFFVESTGRIAGTLSQDSGVAQVTARNGTLNLVLRSSDMTVGLNFVDAPKFVSGRFDAASLVEGRGKVGASFSARDASGSRQTGKDPAGTIELQVDGDRMSGSFELSFSLLGDDGSVEVRGQFQNLATSP